MKLKDEHFAKKLYKKGNRGKMFYCWVENELLKGTKKKAKQDGVTIQNIVEAAFRLYLKS